MIDICGCIKSWVIQSFETKQGDLHEIDTIIFDVLNGVFLTEEKLTITEKLAFIHPSNLKFANYFSRCKKQVEGHCMTLGNNFQL